MTRDDLYTLWTPSTSPWSDWVKPVLFAQMQDANPPEDFAWEPFDPLTISPDHAVVIDLPGPAALHLVRAAMAGLRPVPLYNALPGPSSADSVVPVRDIAAALKASADWLKSLNLPANAPPVFLLDANRNPSAPRRLPGMFDNRSISLPTDFPSAAMLKFNGVRGVILITARREPPAADLAHTLCRWQDAGLPLSQLGLADHVTHALTVAKPTGFRTLWHNLLATLGLKKSPLGGFGGLLPVPSAS